MQDRQVDLVETIDRSFALEDKLFDTLTFLDEVVIIRGENGSPQPIIAVHNDGEMNWDAWWKAVSELPHMNEPMVMQYDEIPRTATIKVQRLQMERELKK
ncbi:hypothetical protein AWI72_14890 [Listeria monocytogenes]|nr:hypothetical protein AWI72_14890 [Listeria monocytogenes]